jgi:predicted metalloprotease
MRWRDQQESQNVEDARGDAGGGLSFPGAALHVAASASSVF